ncbi:hypothetical protein JHK85_045430 [Glycine max]|nr:hypothetical protein JHK85_045430 [Glycine max]
MAIDASAIVLIPDIMKPSIRPDIVNFVHSNISKNSRQPYAINRRADHQIFAESWEIGRAISRSNQKHVSWHTLVCPDQDVAPLAQENQREPAAYAIAASSIPSLVLAYGHCIKSALELPLIVSDSIKSVEKTKETIKVLKHIRAFPNAEKAKDNHNICEIQNCSVETVKADLSSNKVNKLDIILALPKKEVVVAEKPPEKKVEEKKPKEKKPKEKPKESAVTLHHVLGTHSFAVQHSQIPLRLNLAILDPALIVVSKSALVLIVGDSFVLKPPTQLGLTEFVLTLKEGLDNKLRNLYKPLELSNLLEATATQGAQPTGIVQDISKRAGAFLDFAAASGGTVHVDQVVSLTLQGSLASLASLTREIGPKLVKGDPTRKSDTQKVTHVHHHHVSTPTIAVSDSALKFTRVLDNLSLAGSEIKSPHLAELLWAWILVREREKERSFLVVLVMRFGAEREERLWLMTHILRNARQFVEAIFGSKQESSHMGNFTNKNDPSEESHVRSQLSKVVDDSGLVSEIATIHDKGKRLRKLEKINNKTVVQQRSSLDSRRRAFVGRRRRKRWHTFRRKRRVLKCQKGKNSLNAGIGKGGFGPAFCDEMRV